MARFVWGPSPSAGSSSSPRRETESLPRREREALYRRALAQAIEEHRSIVGKVVWPIVTSLLLFFGVVIAFQLLPRGPVPMSIRPILVAVLIGQMALVVAVVARRGFRAGAARAVELEIKKRLKHPSRVE